MVRPLGLLRSIRTRSILTLSCALLVGFILLICSQSASAQTCAGGNALVWKQYATPLSDGLIHIAVNYSGGSTAPTATIKNLAQGAVADWNLYKCITGVVFEESTSSADL